MAGPLSNLKKSKKVPLPRRECSVPFRNSDYEENTLLDDVTKNMIRDSSWQRPGRQKATKQSDIVCVKKSAPTDIDLMSTMMSRLSRLEVQLLQRNREIMEKDKNIAILQEKVNLLQKTRGVDDASRVRDLEQQCIGLQQQVHEMEDFLTDYGMVWVGGEKDSGSGQPAECTAIQHRLDDSTSSSDVSLPCSSAQPNYDIILQNIAELNLLAGEGISHVVHSKGKASLKMPECLPLTLYANGIMMFAGPFRSFDDPTTRQCLKDIADGYFPSELQKQFPDGIPFDVKDMRSVTFSDIRHHVFKGAGRTLQAGADGSDLVTHDASTSNNTVTPSTCLPGQQVSTESFLNKLPQSVIKDGQIIDIRTSIGEMLTGDVSSAGSAIIVVETEATVQLKDRGASADRSRLTTLRVKTGDKTCLLKMRLADTIAHLRRYLDLHSSPGSTGYDIVSTFPSRVYDDDSATLEDCGLFPNATLHLKSRNR